MPDHILTEDPAPYGADPASKPETCHWTQDDRDGHWTTACGHAFEFIDGGPLQNDFCFCPFCGRPLYAQIPAPDEFDDGIEVSYCP